VSGHPGHPQWLCHWWWLSIISVHIVRDSFDASVVLFPLRNTSCLSGFALIIDPEQFSFSYCFSISFSLLSRQNLPKAPESLVA